MGNSQPKLDLGNNHIEMDQGNNQRNLAKQQDKSVPGIANQQIYSSFIPSSSQETTFIANIPNYKTPSRNRFKYDIKFNLFTPAFRMLWMLTLFIGVIILNLAKCSGGLVRYWIVNGIICALILGSTIFAGVSIHYNWKERQALGDYKCA